MATTISLPPSRSNLRGARTASSTTGQTIRGNGIGSQTQTVPVTPTRLQPVLHLRGADTSTGQRRRIQWADDVVDNEGLGRKSSKVCCIYHAPKPIDESSDESSDDSSSDDSEPDNSTARPVGGSKRGGGDKCGSHGHDHGGKGKGKGRKTRARSPNAYEKVPKPRGGGGGTVQG